jgi:hypothetical protein
LDHQCEESAILFHLIGGAICLILSAALFAAIFAEGRSVDADRMNDAPRCGLHIACLLFFVIPTLMWGAIANFLKYRRLRRLQAYRRMMG